ncbi:uncharacterized protein J7T54_005308 [Emericellopsis cladophorae]|uniref:Uncharacterized protein n=1 Tax=Emericellopsis cladophorae TaxID=2686198 RepID=A0A9Q0BDP9_9HYPO|nr:uncharacterized protein J7T54_005308 [Emericellopsis cladophorae]KAI6781597.1 hypothetical protein J7T54_005308 [Emericellopsis cladophorae]
MRPLGGFIVALTFNVGATWAAEIRHLDGIHRVEKKAETTARAHLPSADAVVDKRAKDNGEDICGTSMKLCPESMKGGCCPENYSCGVSSCYATTKGPSTCGTLVGWYACDQVYGGGCCPDGYLCQTADNCIPPSGSAYTLDCPASHYLCPESMSYGCCPDGMGCAVNQCYSIESSTVTEAVTVTTTEDGERRVFTTRQTTVETPAAPTRLPEVDAGDDDEQFILKVFPSVIAKQTAAPQEDDDDNSSGGLTQGQLAGIVTGAVVFLIVVIVVAFIIIRHLNKVVAAVASSGSHPSNPRPVMKQFRPTDSEIDALSVDPLILSPRVAAVAKNAATTTWSPDALSSTDPTPSSFNGAYVPVSTSQSRHTSFDSQGNVSSYFDAIPGRNSRFSTQTWNPQQSADTKAPLSSGNTASGDSSGTYMHVRHWSHASEEEEDVSDARNVCAAAGTLGVPAAPAPPSLLTELEAKSVVPELVGSPTGEYRRRSSGSNVSISGMLSRHSSSNHQRLRSESTAVTTATGGLDVVDEETNSPTNIARQQQQEQTGQDVQRPGSALSWQQGDDQGHARAG